MDRQTRVRCANSVGAESTIFEVFNNTRNIDLAHAALNVVDQTVLARVLSWSRAVSSSINLMMRFRSLSEII